jgi:hypothetical protein
MKSFLLILAFLAAQIAPPPANGAIEGTVVDSVSQLPLANTPISVTSGTLQMGTISDQSGRFLLPSVAPGPYTIAAAMEGYVTPETSTSIYVTSGEIRQVTLSLVPSSAIRGTILDDSGAPLAGAAVQIMRVTYPSGIPTVSSVGSRSADESGNYRMPGLRPGEYYVVGIPKAGSALIRTYAPSGNNLSQASMIRLHPGEEMSGVNVTFLRGSGYRVSGQVLSTIPDATTATVTLLPRGGALQDRGSTSSTSISMGNPANGRFELSNILPGIYDVFASLPDNRGYGASFGRTTVAVNGGDMENVAVTVQRGVDVRGRVTIDGGSSPSFNSVRISLQPMDNASALPVYQQVSRFQPTINPDGSFTIPSVPEATYRVVVSFAPPAPSPVLSAANNRQADPFAPDPTPPPALTTVALAGAPLGSNSYVFDIQQSGRSVYNTGVFVGPQSFDSLEVHVRTDGGGVSGIILDARLLPVGGATVVLAPLVQYRDNPALFRVTLSDERGRFAMSGIRPGEYKMLAWDSIAMGAYLNPQILGDFRDKEMPVTISGNIQVETKLTVISTGN